MNANNLTTIVSRFGIAAVALCAGIWMALALGSARSYERAFDVAFAGTRPTPAQTRDALADARDARHFDADAPARLLEWRLLVRSEQRAQAERVLLRVVASEPSNYEAWVYLAQTTGRPPLVLRARARLRALHPPS